MRYVRSGRGEPTNELCGTPRMVVSCSSPDPNHRANVARLVFHNCKSLTCPKCYEAGATRGARAIQHRLEGMAGAYRKAGKRLGAKKHIVLSPPQADWPRERLEADGGRALRRKACQLLKRFAKDGAEGGTVVVHGERKKHLDGSECERDGCRRRHTWVWGPHIHYLGYGFLEDSSYFYAQTGWIYKRVDETKDRERSFFATAKYLLTHSASFVGADGRRVGQGYHHVGWMANCKGGARVVSRTWETGKCACGRELHDYGVVWEGMTPTEKPNFTEDQGEHQVLVEVREWYLNGAVFKQTVLDLEPDPGGS